ncbi:MAG: UDP-N-acetylmuramoyl-tripeptide--D-alanyl-D-alanine ligase [Proteobacteria bacterium]|nr:UDP-N-acetylmuramoyl-tripeptide--D-alanyl-D-alanine ligase [Pseudomonadota bacterium]
MFGTAGEVKQVLSGVIQGDEKVLFDGISIDSRTIKKGEIFIAIKGERFDGHLFVEEAIKKGAVGVIANRDFKGSVKDGHFFIYVEDTKKALGKIANYWRKKVNPKVIAITGSCGKTSTKEIIHSLLSRKYSALKNHANLNNYYGVSLTLLKLRNEEFAVVETGINHKGEMKDLAEIILPNGSLATNIAPVHLEGIPSLKEIFLEKSILLNYAKEVVFINSDDKYLCNYSKKGVEIIKFGKKGDISYKNVKILNEREMSFSLFDDSHIKREIFFPYPGINLPVNVAGAVAVARYFGIDWENIVDALKNVSLPKMRMETKKIEDRTVIIDAYNSNPYAVKNAVGTFNRFKFKKKALILGDMRELGKWSGYYHAMLGKYLLNFDFNEIYLVGQEIKKTFEILKKHGKKNVYYFEHVEDLKTKIKNIIRKNDALLLKGSRSIALERLLEEELGHAV